MRALFKWIWNSLALFAFLEAVEVEAFWSPDNGKTLYGLPIYMKEPGKVLVRLTCGDPVLEPQDGNWYATIKSREDFASALSGKPAWSEGWFLQRRDPPWIPKTVRTVDFILDLGERAEGAIGKGNRWDDAQKKFVDAPLPPCPAAGKAALVAEIHYKDKQTGVRTQGQKNLEVIFAALPAGLKPVSGGEKVYAIPKAPVRVFPERAVAPVPPGYLGTHFSAGGIMPLDWELVVPRRFPSMGIGKGAMLRCFLPSKPKQTEVKGGVTYERPNRTWWGHLQSGDQDRGWGPEANYRYYQSDFRMLLGWAESLGANLFVVAPGWPHQTKETAMAAVAYANGKVGDPAVIGVDKRGEDWKTVGYWAEQRAKGDDRHAPHPAPFGVKYWEIGNEDYYAHNAVPWSNWLFLEHYDNVAPGRNSAERARLFLEGRDYNGEKCEGFLAYAAAMKRVDPSIQIAAMLAPEHKAKWHWDWNEVLLTRLKGVVDLFTYHGYTHSSTLDEEGGSLQAGKEGRTYITAIRAHMRETGNGAAPLANTEWHCYEPLKAGSIRMASAVYLTDMLGIMLEEQLAFNCAYGPFDTKHGNDGGWMNLLRPMNASDYRKSPASEGIYDRPTAFRWPSYYAFALWRDFGDQLVAVENPWDATNQISIFAGARGGRVTVIAVNKSGKPQRLRLAAAGLGAEMAVDEVAPAKGSVKDEDVTYNGIDMSSPEAQKMDALERIPPLAKLRAVDGEFRFEMRAWGLARLRGDR